MKKEIDNSSDLYVVIPVHNRMAFTRGCLDALAAQTEVGFKVIIVDDGSTDGTTEMVRNEYPGIILLLGDGNLWWTGSINKGVQEALDRSADYIITLNDDTIPPPDFVKRLLESAGNNPGALIGASAVDVDTNEWVYGGEKIEWFSAKTIQLLDILADEKRVGLHEVDFFPGRGLLVPSAVYRTVGLYDEKHFPHGLADNDFTLRASRAGYRIFCDYDIKLRSISGESYGLKLMKNRTWKNYCQHLFHIKGGGNLGFFIYYALRNCPRRYLPFFLTAGILRRCFGYWLHKR